MKKYISCFVLVFILSSCSVKEETPMEFAVKFTQAMADNNREAVESIFVNTKSEIKKMVGILQKNEALFEGKTMDEKVEKIFGRINKELPNVLNKIKSGTVDDWGMLEIKTAEFKDVSTLGENIDVDDDVRAGEIYVLYMHKNEPLKIRFEVLDLKDGKFSLVDFPRAR